MGSPTFKISTILALSDLEEDSLTGLRAAYAMAKERKARLVVGHVLIPRTLDPSDVREFLAANGLDPEAAVIDIEVDADVLSGIDLMVDREHPDLVVVSSRRKRGFTRILTASVPVGLVGKALAPVLALHSGREAPASYRKALVCLDGSTQSSLLLGAAGELLGKDGAVTAFMVVEDSPLVVGGINVGTYGPDTLRRADEAAGKYLAALKPPRAGMKLATEHRVGNAVEQILEAIRRHGADLVVIGTGGIGGSAHFFIGRVAGEVVRHADIAALVVPTRRPAS